MRDLPPNIFAIVMATGIVALALNAAGWFEGGLVLFWMGVVAYGILWVLTLGRCARHWPVVRVDLTSHARAPGFFTMVAATGVLGNCGVILYGATGAGFILWVAAVFLWVCLSYTILPALIEVENKPDIEKGLSGVWLLIVVGTQSVCVLGCLAAPHLPGGSCGPVLFASLCFWLAGGMLYLWLIALIFYRIVFRPLTPAELAPPYWINMGAMAISTLAGVSLVSVGQEAPLLGELRPFLVGLSLMFWATATWWLPLLLMLGFWRHIVKRYPLTYEHGYWGAVFPLGMYSVCTFRLGREFGVPFLTPLAEAFAWIALIAWSAAAIGLIRRVAGASTSPGAGRVLSGERGK